MTHTAARARTHTYTNRAVRMIRHVECMRFTSEAWVQESHAFDPALLSLLFLLTVHIHLAQIAMTRHGDICMSVYPHSNTCARVGGDESQEKKKGKIAAMVGFDCSPRCSVALLLAPRTMSLAD